MKPQDRTDGDPAGHAEHDFTGPLTPRVRLILRLLIGACVLLFALDLVVDRTTHAPGEGLPGFYAVYGFVGCVLLVLSAKQLRKVVMRDEQYYRHESEIERREAREAAVREEGDR